MSSGLAISIGKRRTKRSARSDAAATARRGNGDGMSPPKPNRTVFKGHEKAAKTREALAFLVQHGQAREGRTQAGRAHRLVDLACGNSEECEQGGRPGAPAPAPPDPPRSHSAAPRGLDGREVFELGSWTH